MKLGEFFTIISLFSLLVLPSFAIEEISLDIDEEELPTQQGEVFENFKQESSAFKERIIKASRQEITSTSKIIYPYEEVFTKHLEGSVIKTMHFYGFYRAAFNEEFSPDDNDSLYDFSEISAGVRGNFRDSKTFYDVRMRFNPNDNYSFLQYMPSNIYIATKAIPNHTIYLGNVRTPNGYEAMTSTELLPFFSRAQISKHFGNTRKIGLRVKGNYNYIDYDFGGFSSDTYFRDFFPGAEFAGRITLKPFGGKNKEKIGELRIGGTTTAGKNNVDYFVAGAYARYDYKKFFADFEWAKADGYSGSRGISSNQAEGLYSTLGYKITPKLQFLARYDQFKPNTEFSNEVKKEYSCGFNYFMKGQALKLILNYVFCQNNITDDSHRIILGTQFLL